MRNGDLILEVAKNMHLLADSLAAAVNGSGQTVKKETPVRSAEPEKPSVPVKTYTKEEARDILIAIRAKGFNDQIRAILTKHGYEKFTSVPPEEYPAIIAEAEALIDAAS